MRTVVLFTLFAMIGAAGMSGCATSPFGTMDETVAPYGPADVLRGEAATGERVVWGGRIVAVDNLPDRTELVVAAYPLDRADRPRIRQQAGVRFVLVEDGFLEPMNWPPGRYLTVVGTISGVTERATGEHVHPHPVLLAEEIHLWPADPSQWRSGPRFSVGIGVRL